MLKNLKDFLEMQKDLDNYILTNKSGIIDKRQLLADTILGMSVEVGEYANTTRCFKHWSNKPPDFKHIRLEEFVDIFFFWLSIANQEKFTDEDIEEAYLNKLRTNYNRANNKNY